MNTKRFISIRTQLLVMLSICLLIPFLFYWFYTYRYIKDSLGQKFITQTTDMMDASARNISDYVQLVNYTARGLYFNSEVMDILSDSAIDVRGYHALEVEAKIFNYMQMMFASVPDSTQIHLSAFHLKKSLLLRNDMQRYEKDHIYLNPERNFACEPYGSYILPTHMQSDYNFNTLPYTDFTLTFSLNMPIYEIPSVTNAVGEISIDIPVTVLAEICRPLFKEEEYLCIVDEFGNYIYSSDPVQTGTLTKDEQILSILGSSFADQESYLIEQDDDNIVICTRLAKSPLNWYLVKRSPAAFVYEDAIAFFRMMFLGFIAVLIIETLLIFLTIVRFTTPIKRLTEYAEAVNQGNLDEKMSKYITYTGNDEIGLLLITFRRMMHSINHFIIHQYRLELANRTSELKALQAQINPHFIYNTLQYLGSEALESDNLPLYNSITALGQMMQYSMDTGNSLVPLKDCLNYIEQYLNLQKMRFPSSMTCRYEIEDGLEEFIVPKMILQPLVENSIRHGKLLKLEQASLVIRAYRKENILHLLVEDSGSGMTFERMQEINKQLAQVKQEAAQSDTAVFLSSLGQTPKEVTADREVYTAGSNNIGLANVYQRLLLYYQRQCRMEIISNESCGTTVHIQIDCHMGKQKEVLNESFNR